MSNIPKISEAEWAVMKALWNENPITSNRVIEVVSESTNWQPKTIRTLLNRLVSKGAVGHDGKGREYRFFPLIEESVVAKAESTSFLSRVFGGALKPALAAMVESEKLTKEDIEELKRILDKIQGE